MRPVRAVLFEPGLPGSTLGSSDVACLAASQHNRRRTSQRLQVAIVAVAGAQRSGKLSSGCNAGAIGKKLIDASELLFFASGTR